MKHATKDTARPDSGITKYFSIESVMILVRNSVHMLENHTALLKTREKLEIGIGDGGRFTICLSARLPAVESCATCGLIDVSPAAESPAAEF